MPGAQILLLVLGVALLSIAAIFYLVYACLAFGVLAKALSTLAVTPEKSAFCAGAAVLSTLALTPEKSALLSLPIALFPDHVGRK